MIAWADVSHLRTVDLRGYAAAGHDRIALKATEGTTFTDPAFAARWSLAGQLGLARVAYHFAAAADAGAADFDHFLGVVLAAGGVGRRDLLCLDSEDPAGVSRAGAHAREFTARAVARGYPSGCLYTGRWYAEPANLRAVDLAPGWRRLWISDYGTAPDGQIGLPAGWSRDQVIARQYTSAATMAGITGPVDANRTLIDWLAVPEEDPTMTLTAADLAALAQALGAHRFQIEGHHAQWFTSPGVTAPGTRRWIKTRQEIDDLGLQHIPMLTVPVTHTLARLAPVGDLPPG